MGLISKAVKVVNGDKKQDISIVQLTREEISILLELLKNSNFSGNMIDTLYHLTAKLQKEYIKGE
tara:strand:+ start:161 stop:355 length:195 start_codon:yes stop_codon:yes gene_type:complete